MLYNIITQTFSNFCSIPCNNQDQHHVIMYHVLTNHYVKYKYKMKVAQSCPTLCNAMDCSPWNSPGQNSEVGSLSLLQGIFPTQELNPGLPHCRQILYQLSHQGSNNQDSEVTVLFCPSFPTNFKLASAFCLIIFLL